MMDERATKCLGEGLAGGLADMGVSKLTEKLATAATGDADVGKVAGTAMTLASLSLPSGTVATAAVNTALAAGTAGLSAVTTGIAVTTTVVTAVAAPVAIGVGIGWAIGKLASILFDD